MDRRNFITHASLTALATSAICRDVSMASAGLDPNDYPVAIFGKVFQKHSFEQLANILEIVQADGVEATIRSGGHIDPSKLGYENEIDSMIDALTKRGKRLLIAATDINEVTPANIRLLQALTASGVQYYRMGYYKYDSKGSLMRQAEEFALKAKELAQLNRELKLVGLYQNHAGKDYVGSLLWDLAVVLKDVPAEDLGVALDLRHLRAEISGSYRTAISAIGPHLRSIYLKDTRRMDLRGDELEEVALGDGLVTSELFLNVWQLVAPAPLSVHVEYFGQKPYDVDKAQIVIDAYKSDVATLRKWMENGKKS